MNNKSQPFNEKEMANILRFIRACEACIQDVLDQGCTLDEEGKFIPPEGETKNKKSE